MKKKISRKAIIWITILTIIVMYILAAIFFNNVIQPYRGFDKNVLINCKENDSIKYEEEFEKFFYEFVNYKQYEEEYTTDFYFNYNDKLHILFPGVVGPDVDDAQEGYSYIIRANDKYEDLKNKLLKTLPFLETPIGDEEVYYIDSIAVNGWVFKEIYFYPYYGEPSQGFYEYIRDMMCWLGCNDEKKEITFSYIYDRSLDYYPDEDYLKEYIKANIYT